ncbi:hypothetical protein V5O48_004296 [Marasmius crinis-equi]|uniref:Uncharacterized protein n=1 Tax=Marasmius crinis-equi TaxID=585013 RepID=A0ABR3FQH4_9AGAR
MDTSSTAVVASIVSSLGGPRISPGDLEWVLEIEGGRKLTDWLASQLCTVQNNEGDETDEMVRIRAALSSIALEDEEVVRCGLKPEDPTEHPNWEPVPATYLTPSRQREYLTYLDNAAYTTENEVDLLNKRIKQTQIVSAQLFRSTKQIKAELEHARSETSEIHERLAELSLETDLVISTAKLHYEDLLGSLADLDNSSQGLSRLVLLAPSSYPDTLNKARVLQAGISSQRTKVIDKLKHGIDAIAKTKSTCIPSIEEVEVEARRLTDALLDFHGSQDIQNAALAEQLFQLARIIDESDEEEDVYGVLRRPDLSNTAPTSPSTAVDDIVKELKTAWSQAQEVLIDGRITVLEKAIAELKVNVIPPSRELYNMLSEDAKYAKEVHSLVEMYNREMDGIRQDMLEAEKEVDSENSIGHQGLSPIEREIVELLKRTKDFRAPETGPLVLLDRQDVNSELGALGERRKSAEQREEHWVETLSLDLNVLQASHNSVLSATYARSPLNTSEPYSTASNVVKLRRVAREQSDQLVAIVQNLEKEVKTTVEGERSQKRLRSFVDQWIGVTHEGI